MKTNNSIIEIVNMHLVKRVATIVIILFTLGVVKALAVETLILSGESTTSAPWGSAATYDSGTGTFATSAGNSVGLSWTNVYKNGGIQIKANTSNEFHSTSYPSTNNKIKSIRLVAKTNSPVLYGSTDLSTWTSISYISGTAVNVSSYGYKYFKVTAEASKYVQVTSITVIYEGDGLHDKFYESFYAFKGTGGNDNSWSGSIAGTSIESAPYTDNAGWTFLRGYKGAGCAKLGTTSYAGVATTPSISVTSGKSYILSFKAGAWTGDACSVTVSASGASITTAVSPSGALSNSSFTTYTATLTATSTSMTITFTGTDKKRFFIDEISVSTKPTLYTVTFNAEGGYCATSSLVEESEGGGVTLPLASPSSDCSLEGWCFAGWKETSAQASASTPSSKLWQAGEVYHPTSDTELHAVFFLADGNNYLYIENLYSLYDGAKLVITGYYNKEEHAVSNTTDASGYIQSTKVTPIDGELISSPANSIIWTLNGYTNNWSLKNVGNNKYIKVSNRPALANAAETFAITYELDEDDYDQFNIQKSSNYLYMWDDYTFSGEDEKTYIYFYQQQGTYDSNPTCVSCNDYSTIEAASSDGAVTSTSIPVQCANGISDIGENCSLASYGFCWNTSGSPNIDDDDSYEVGTSIGEDESFSYTLIGLTPNTTYYIRPYATNGHGTAYGTAYTVATLQSYTITYNNNGGSGSMDADHKDHGVNFTLPNTAGSMSKTGYHMDGWLLGSSSGTEYVKGGSYTDNAAAEFYVKWTANTYSITLNDNGATTSGSTSITLTYNSTSHDDITNPEKTDYIFDGWYSGSGGTGNLVIDKDGVLQADVSTYTGAGGIWTKDGGTTLYAKWTEHTYTNYRTSCCDYRVTFTQNDPENGTVEFSRSTLATCGASDAERQRTMTITPTAGYKLKTFEVATGDGKVVASSTSPAVVVDEDNSDAQVITLTFAQNANGNYDVTATFEQMHDEYYDYMHDNAKVGANRTGIYSAPTRSSKTATTGADCKENHYKFKGWVVSDEVNEDGTLKSGYVLITSGTSMTASNKIYYAVWAEEE